MLRTRLMLLALIGASGCRWMDSPAKPVVLPPASNITSIEVTTNDFGLGAAAVITDRNKIDRFVNFVNSRQDRWKKPWDTFPAGMYTVVVKHNDDMVAVFWPSSGHIGGREGGQGADSNRLRPLSDDEWSELQSILDLAADGPPSFPPAELP